MCLSASEVNSIANIDCFSIEFALKQAVAHFALIAIAC
jgi:hypothetical protein